VKRFARVLIRFAVAAALVLCAACVTAPSSPPAAPAGQEKPAARLAAPAPAGAPADTPTPTPDALPFTIEYVPQTGGSFATLPAVQAYSIAPTKDGLLLLVGGRITSGLHMFTSDQDNFPKTSSNHWLWVIDPKTGTNSQFDVNSLGPALAGPLSATNAQSWYDANSDLLYVIGGYGWNADQTDMKTFPTILTLPVSKVVAALSASPPDPATIKSLIGSSTDQRFAVTGGGLFNLGGSFFLTFGQRFDGLYRAFGGSEFTQTYTEQIRQFTLTPGTLRILAYGAITNADADRPFHRRDGSVVMSVDPASGNSRIAAFGGVFAPGKIAAYANPVYVDASGAATVDRSTAQLFSQYQCPVVVTWDSAAKTVYHTFMGGIGGHWWFQTPSQHAAYVSVTQQGRNDGFPFLADVTTYVEKSDRSYQQWLHTQPTPGNRLLGASINFIVDPALVAAGGASSQGVIQLATWNQGERKLIGYAFGGIEAENPLPLVPNSGTAATNTLSQVYLTRTPTAAYPASIGHDAVPSPDLKLR
jgi:hypothetical protein